jgi:hypothetical protein
MNRGDEFEALFNTLDANLRERLAARTPAGGRRASFVEIVRDLSRADNAVAYMRHDLEEFADLRNAIVHSRGLRGLRVIAEPVPEALDAFRRLVDDVTRPRPAVSLSGERVEPFPPSTPLSRVLTYMRERDYSQVVVQAEGDPLRVVTTSGITHWLEHHVGDGMVLLEDDVSVAHALAHEPPRSFAVMDHTATVYDVRARFLEFPQGGTERLHAVVLTHSGRDVERPLGIVTPWGLFDDRR